MIADLAAQALADARTTVETVAKAAVRAFLDDPDGLELHTCHVDEVEEVTVMCDRTGHGPRIAHDRNGDLWLVTKLEDGQVTRSGPPLKSVEDLGRRLAKQAG